MAAQLSVTDGLYFYMMGPLTIFHSGSGAIAALNRKEEALLCFLKVNGRSCSRRELEALLWPDAAKPQVSLRVAINHLRQADLEQFLDITDEAMAFNQHNHWSDVEALQYQLQQTLAHAYADLPALMHIVDQCGNGFLPEFDCALSPEFEEWRLKQQAKIMQLLLRALEQLMSLCSEQGDVQNALRYAARLVEIAPWHRNAQLFLINAGRLTDKPPVQTFSLPAHVEWPQNESQDAAAAQAAVIVSVGIEKWPLAQVCDLLQEQAGLTRLDTTDEAVELLWELVDAHPLALVLVGRQLRERPFLTIATINHRLSELRQQNAGSSAETGLSAVLRLCFAGLKSSAKELMQPIVKLASPHFSIPELVQASARTAFLIQDDIDYLMRFALLQKIDETQYQLPLPLLEIFKTQFYE